MKTITKIEKVKRWLMSGKSLTSMQAINHFQYTRLADGIYKLKHRGMWIINIGNRKFAKYIMLEIGPIKNLMILGHRLEIIEAEYLQIMGMSIIDYSDMDILIEADDGITKKRFWCNSEAFRDNKIMLKAIKEAKK